MVQRTLLVAAAVVLGLASSASASFSYGTAPTEISRGANVVDVFGEVGLAAVSGAPNGTGAGYELASGNGIQTVVLRWTLASNVLGFRIFTHNTSQNVSITAIRLFDGGGNQALTTNTFGYTTSSGNEERLINDGFDEGQDYSLVVGGGPFDFTNITSVQITWSLDSTVSGAHFRLDAVANPEPGTIALFGLGALGLAGLVRRRRARALPTQS